MRGHGAFGDLVEVAARSQRHGEFALAGQRFEMHSTVDEVLANAKLVALRQRHVTPRTGKAVYVVDEFSGTHHQLMGEDALPAAGALLHTEQPARRNELVLSILLRTELYDVITKCSWTNQCRFRANLSNFLPVEVLRFIPTALWWSPLSLS